MNEVFAFDMKIKYPYTSDGFHIYGRDFYECIRRYQLFLDILEKDVYYK